MKSSVHNYNYFATRGRLLTALDHIDRIEGLRKKLDDLYLSSQGFKAFDVMELNSSEGGYAMISESDSPLHEEGDVVTWGRKKYLCTDVYEADECNDLDREVQDQSDAHDWCDVTAEYRPTTFIYHFSEA